MEELETKLRRTLLDFLLSADMNDAARSLVHADLHVLYDNWDPYAISIDLPAANLIEVQKSEEIMKQIDNAVRLVSHGHIEDRNGYVVDIKEMRVEYRVKLVEDDDGWQSKLENIQKTERKFPELED